MENYEIKLVNSDKYDENILTKLHVMFRRDKDKNNNYGKLLC